MRVDDSCLPEGKAVRVRCPHCQGIGTVGPLATDPGKSAPAPATASEPSTALPDQPKAPTVEAPQPEHRQELFDPLNDISFPADSGPTLDPAAQPRRKWLRMAIWAVVSLAVVGFFALLVNIVLPGPRHSTRATDQAPPSNVPQPEDLLGPGSGPLKPRIK